MIAEAGPEVFKWAWLLLPVIAMLGIVLFQSAQPGGIEAPRTVWAGLVALCLLVPLVPAAYRSRTKQPSMWHLKLCPSKYRRILKRSKGQFSSRADTTNWREKGRIPAKQGFGARMRECVKI